MADDQPQERTRCLLCTQLDYKDCDYYTVGWPCNHCQWATRNNPRQQAFCREVGRDREQLRADTPIKTEPEDAAGHEPPQPPPPPQAAPANAALPPRPAEPFPLPQWREQVARPVPNNGFQIGVSMPQYLYPQQQPAAFRPPPPQQPMLQPQYAPQAPAMYPQQATYPPQAMQPPPNMFPAPPMQPQWAMPPPHLAAPQQWPGQQAYGQQVYGPVQHLYGAPAQQVRGQRPVDFYRLEAKVAGIERHLAYLAATPQQELQVRDAAHEQLLEQQRAHRVQQLEEQESGLRR